VENIMSSKLFTTRQGTILLGVIAAVIAAIALLVYLNHYRSSVKNSNTPFQVLAAKSLIQRGTSGDVIGSSALYKRTSLPKSQVKTGAFVDPSTLAGKVALTDIYPGQQLTAADFGPSAGGLAPHIGRAQRAVTISLPSDQQVGAQIGFGSHVDVWVSLRNAEHLMFQNMYVLGVSGGNVTLRTNPRQAGVVIFAAQTSKIWLVLRPTVGSVQGKGRTVGSADLGR